MQLGKTIKEIRRSRKMTQEEFSQGCGITQTYLSQIESESKEPTISTIDQISKFIGVPVPVLFYMSMDEKDVAPSKQEAFKKVSQAVNSLLDEFFDISPGQIKKN